MVEEKVKAVKEVLLLREYVYMKSLFCHNYLQMERTCSEEKTHLQLKLFSADSLSLIKVNVFDSKMYLLAI